MLLLCLVMNKSNNINYAHVLKVIDNKIRIIKQYHVVGEKISY